MNRVSTVSWIPGFLFVAAVPLFLIAASVTYAINDAGLYNKGFQRYNVSAITGITVPDLEQAGAELRDYFNTRTEPLSVRTRIFGLDQELFNRREVLHMADVKRLIWGVYALGAITGVYLLIFTVAGLVWRPRIYAGRVARYYLWGGIITLSFVLVVGLFSVVAFETLFLLFHRISFRNNLWQLNPYTDYLLMMFPEGFWFDATLRVATVIVVGAAVAVVGSASYLWWQRRDREPGISPQQAGIDEAR